MSRFHVVFGCRSDRGRDARRNSANASIVSQRLRYQRRFYLRPKFRQLQRLLGPAYPKSETSKSVSEGLTRSRPSLTRFGVALLQKSIEIRSIDWVKQPENQLRSSDSI